MTLALLLLGCRTVLVPDVPMPEGDPSAAWEAVLRDVVTDDGLVDYHALQGRRGALDEYVKWLGRDRPRVDRENGQHHLWLNAYTALAMYGVLEAGIPSSVDEVDGWLPWQGAGFFVERAFIVQQFPVSLSEIAHEQLRGRVMDFRDHAAIHAPFWSSPPVRRELYRQGDVEDQLRDQMERWLGDPNRGLRVDGDTVWLSALFEQHAHDFALFSAEPDPCRVASRFVPPDVAARLEDLSARGCSRKYLPFDRRLNDARAR